MESEKSLIGAAAGVSELTDGSETISTGAAAGAPPPSVPDLPEVVGSSEKLSGATVEVTEGVPSSDHNLKEQLFHSVADGSGKTSRGAPKRLRRQVCYEAAYRPEGCLLRGCV